MGDDKPHRCRYGREGKGDGEDFVGLRRGGWLSSTDDKAGLAGGGSSWRMEILRVVKTNKPGAAFVGSLLYMQGRLL